MSETTTDGVPEPRGQQSAASAAIAAAGTMDERLAYRSIFQRLFIRPEIGAIIGVIGVWTFFWAVSLNFGTTGQTQNWLDTASTLGIMAVAVSMLMIGGEFDLSSGANTGAMGILFILLIKEVGDLGGLGLSIWIAVPLSFVVAMGIGYFNGQMVEKTALPSFIVTLATFFILRGLKLGLAKLLTGQISVTFTDEAHGYSFWQQVFAGEWQRNDHVWNGRDWYYIGFLVVGASVVALATCTMHFTRKRLDSLVGTLLLPAGVAGIWLGVQWLRVIDFFPSATPFKPLLVALVSLVLALAILAAGAISSWLGITRSPRWFLIFFAGFSGVLAGLLLRYSASGAGADVIGPIVIAAGLAVALFGLAKSPAGFAILAAGYTVVGAGIYLLHTTDSVSANVLAAAVIAAGVIIALFGFGHWQFEPVKSAGGIALNSRLVPPLIAGLAAIGAACVASFAIDSSNSETLFFPFTVQGLRAVLMILLASAGISLLMIAANRALSVNPTTKLVVSTLTAAAIVAFAFVVRGSAEAAKFRTEIFTVFLLAALALFAWSMIGLRYKERRQVDGPADNIGMKALVVGIGLMVVAVVLRHLFVTDAELIAEVNPAKFSVRMLWFFAFTAVMALILAKTRFGSWVFAVGGNKQASRQVGVPAARTKTQLFMIVSGAAWLVGMLLAFRLSSLQAGAGDGEEFEYIIAAVVGGTMLTGGYGSAIGAAFGAAIMAMSLVGIQAARWETDWRFVFLGAILLLAVIANRFIRDKADSARR